MAEQELITQEEKNPLLSFPQLPQETLYERFIASKLALECAKVTLTSHTDYGDNGWLSYEAKMIVLDIEDVAETVGMVLSAYGNEYAERRANKC